MHSKYFDIRSRGGSELTEFILAFIQHYVFTENLEQA